jgi:transposase
MVSSVFRAAVHEPPVEPVGAGTGFAHWGNRTSKVNEFTPHPQAENVTLDAARDPVPEGASGVRTAVAMFAGPGASKVGSN